MSKFTVIGISGEAGHGKGKVAGTLELFHDAVRVSLAGPIKSQPDLIGGDDGWLWKEYEEAGWSRRRFLKIAGTESRESAGVPSVWTDVALTWISYLTEHHPDRKRLVVVPDVRFPHEQDLIRGFCLSKGGSFLMVDVIRPGHGNRAGTDHKSETERSKLVPDITLVSDGTLSDLILSARRLVPGGLKFSQSGPTSVRIHTSLASKGKDGLL